MTRREIVKQPKSENVLLILGWVMLILELITNLYFPGTMQESTKSTLQPMQRMESTKKKTN